MTLQSSYINLTFHKLNDDFFVFAFSQVFALPCSRQTSAPVQVFDVGAVGPQNILALKEVAIFLAQPLPDPATALGIYVSVGGQQWQFRGYVANSHPSE